MKKPLRVVLANHFPWLGAPRRMLRAALDAISPTRESYSQHGEDLWVLGQLAGIDLARAIYVEVGAFHPTSISNTYLFYRNGLRGVLIEPNSELVRLDRWIRRGDTVVGVGCSREPSIGTLQIYSTPADNSFADARVHRNVVEKGLNLLRTELVPMLPLDTILEIVSDRWICFLSIDAEGLDDEVLAGASRSLDRTLFVCVEALNTAMETAVNGILSEKAFALAHSVSFNRIYRNTRFDPPLA